MTRREEPLCGNKAEGGKRHVSLAKRLQFDFTVNHNQRCGMPWPPQCCCVLDFVLFCGISECFGVEREPHFSPWPAWTSAPRSAHDNAFFCLIATKLFSSESCVFVSFPCLSTSQCAPQSPFGSVRCCGRSARPPFELWPGESSANQNNTRTRARGTRLVRTATLASFYLARRLTPDRSTCSPSPLRSQPGRLHPTTSLFTPTQNHAPPSPLQARGDGQGFNWAVACVRGTVDKHRPRGGEGKGKIKPCLRRSCDATLACRLGTAMKRTPRPFDNTERK